jgi:hypothetical protein
MDQKCWMEEQSHRVKGRAARNPEVWCQGCACTHSSLALSTLSAVPTLRFTRSSRRPVHGVPATHRGEGFAFTNFLCMTGMTRLVTLLVGHNIFPGIYLQAVLGYNH